MHERNIFKNNKPNFEHLAQKYPEFAQYVHKGSSGKPYVNFKDSAALRSLSVVLLKKFFDLDLEIPLDRLIPTIPLRLNYIHWIEDLLNLNEAGKSTEDEIIGIDVGIRIYLFYYCVVCFPVLLFTKDLFYLLFESFFTKGTLIPPSK